METKVLIGVVNTADLVLSYCPRVQQSRG